jgi:hypothetical protein
MATTMLIHPWLKFTDISLFNVVICVLTSNVDVSDPGGSSPHAAY